MFTVSLLYQNISLSFEISGKNIWAPQIFKKGSKVEKSLKEKTFWQVSFSWGRDFRWKQPKSQKPKSWKVFDRDLGFRFGRIFFSYRFIETKMFRKIGARLFSIAKKNFRLFLLKQKFFFSSHFSGLQYFQFSRHFSDFYWDPTFKVSAEQRKG